MSSPAEEYLSQLDTIVLEGLQTKTHIYQFLQLYGNSRPKILDKLYTSYLNDTLQNNLFFQISRILLVNGHNSTSSTKNSNLLSLNNKKLSQEAQSIDLSWENKCLEKLTPLITTNKNKLAEIPNLPIFPHLIRHVNLTLGFPLDKTECSNCISEMLKIIKTRPSHKTQKDLLSSQTQGKIIKTLNIMKIKYIEEYEIDGYFIDFFLPDLNIGLEYNGPNHYYPLQTQFNEKTKFRYKQIVGFSNIKLIFINYWEWQRIDNDHLTVNYLKKLLYDNYKIEDGPLFYENFDTLKVLRIA